MDANGHKIPWVSIAISPTNRNPDKYNRGRENWFPATKLFLGFLYIDLLKDNIHEYPQ